MTTFNRVALATFVPLLALASAQPAHAAPEIIATNIAATCKIMPDNAVSNVAVTLNGVTASFFQTLYYHFTPASGPTISLPGTGGNPVFLSVPAGTYQLWITTEPSSTATSGVGGGPYTVTATTPKVMTFRGTRRCITIRKFDGIKADAIKKL